MMKTAVLSLALLAGVNAQATTSTTSSAVVYPTTTTSAPVYTTGAATAYSPYATTAAYPYTTTAATTAAYTPYTTTTAAYPTTQQVQYIPQTTQQVQYYPQATQQVQYIPQTVATTPVVQVPTYPQPPVTPRLTGACNLYDTATGTTTKGTIVYAVSVRQLPFCLVLNRANCATVSQLPTGTDSGENKAIYEQTQYFQCKTWRALAANAFKATKAACALISKTSTDAFVVADAAVCTKAAFPLGA